jgi:hypothetical protein
MKKLIRGIFVFGVALMFVTLAAANTNEDERSYERPLVIIHTSLVAKLQ